MCVCGIFFYAGATFTKTEIQRLRNTPWKLDKSNSASYYEGEVIIVFLGLRHVL